MRINITGNIVSDAIGRIYDWMGIPYTSPRKIRDALNKANGADVEIYINSGGGYCTDASEIYTDVREYKGKTTSKIVGIAASAASWVAMATDEVLMSPTALMMIHNSSLTAEGDYKKMDNASELLTQTDEAIRNAYKIKTNKSDEDIKNLMEETTWMNCNKAKELGLIDGVMFDEVISPEEIANSLIPSNGLVNIVNMIEKEGREEVNLNKKDKVQDEAVNVTLDSLKNDHKEIYDEIFNLGVESERERIKNIEDLGVVGNSELVYNAKFTEPVNAEKLAIDYIKAQNRINGEALKNMAEDKKDIVIDNTVVLNSSESEKSEEVAKIIANLMNEGR